MKFIRWLLILVFLIGAGLAYYVSTPANPPGEGVFVDVDRGMSSHQIANLLARDGVVRSPWTFLIVRALHPGATLQAGEYRFDKPVTPWQVFGKIHRGEVYYELITVPEGSNIFDIAAILAGRDTVTPQNFLQAARTTGLIHDLDPQASTLEGFLFPSTYRVTRRTTAQQLCRMMTDEFRTQWRALEPGSADPHRVVTLASLVEKESAVESERPVIAGLFENRLRIGMPLQCDPTTVYAAILEQRYHGVIHRSDLASHNAFNTYAHAGLPPGPITNPGVSALKAALHPASTDYLYFVAKPGNAGSHTFSATLAAHTKAVDAYRSGTH